MTAASSPTPRGRGPGASTYWFIAPDSLPIGRLEEMSVAEWRTVVDINLTGALQLTRAVLPLLKTHGWGRIINVGSGSIFEGVPSDLRYLFHHHYSNGETP